MDKPPTTSNVISSYRKRRQAQGPVIIYGAAGLLVLIGIIMLVVWLTGPSKPLNAIFATDTPTPTITPSPTSTSTPTLTATVTSTATETLTPTPSSPFVYTVQEGDYLALLVQRFSLGDDGVALILWRNPYVAETVDGSIDPVTQNIYPGQKIVMPYPGEPLPTPTPIPPNLPPGTKLDYYVQSGDTLDVIAAKFNSTTEAIIKENKITDSNAIQVGQKLVIPINLVTATATRPPTSTSGPTSSVAFPSVTPVRSVTPSITPKP